MDIMRARPDAPAPPPQRGKAWTEAEERQLYEAYVAGVAFDDIAAAHGRTRGGIRSHLQLLGFLDSYGAPVDPAPDFAPSQAAVKRSAKQAEADARPRRRAPVEGKEVAVEENPQFAEVLSLLMNSDRSVFITGKAGTGKSTLLREFRRRAQKNVVVLAPTGIAALNVGGETIHRFFRFSIDVTPQKAAARKKPRNAGLYKKIDTLVIDEVSMVRADILDCVDAFLRAHGLHPGAAFGGVQMVFIGDLYQLPPVVGAQDREIFSGLYDTPYFFSAKAMADYPLERCELEKVYRQKDGAFVALLNRVRDGQVTDSDLVVLNSRVGAPTSTGDDGYAICLTATNARADEMNRERLDALRGKTYTAAAEISGDFARDYYPAAPELSFKVGAQIMMLNNDREDRWVNGSLGVIEEVCSDIDGKDYVVVRLQGDDAPVAVFPHRWEVYRYALSGNEIESESVGTFAQYPFRLAWAVTIHKSQGKTFNHINIDIGAGAFAAGQVYVALSRCTSLEGIALQTPIKRRHIMTDARIRAYLGHDDGAGGDAVARPDEAARAAFVAILARAIYERAAVDLLYLKGNEEMTRRVIWPRAMGMENHKGAPFLGIRAFCGTDQVEILFSLDRILSVRRSV